MAVAARYGTKRTLWSNWSRLVSRMSSPYLATSDAPSSSRAISTSTEATLQDASKPNQESTQLPESPVNTPVSLNNSAPRQKARINPYPSYPLPEKLHLPPPEDATLAYFTSLIMRDGKRHQAARTVANTLNNLHILTHSSPLPILREAIERAGPAVKVVSQKQRNKSLMTPRPLNAKQRTGQAIRWIIRMSDNRPEHDLDQRLAKEILTIVTNPGSSNVMKKKEEVHKLALANRYVRLNGLTCLRWEYS